MSLRVILILAAITLLYAACGKETVEPEATGPQIANLPPSVSVVPPGQSLRHPFMLADADSNHAYLWQVIATHVAPAGQFGIDTSGVFHFNSENNDSGEVIDFRVLVLENGETILTHDFSIVVSSSGPLVLRLAPRMNPALQNMTIDVSLILSGGTFQLSAFDILIAYDSAVLTPVAVNPGESIAYGACHWEYFSSRFNIARPNPLREHTVRIVGKADIDDGVARDPGCSRLRDGAELARLKFHVSNDRDLECTATPLEFFWTNCFDNSVYASPADPDAGFVGYRVLRPDWDGSFPLDRYLIPASECDSVNHLSLAGYCDGLKTVCPTLTPVDSLIFWNGEIRIVCPDSIDSRP